MNSFVADTYALIEMQKRNQQYAPYKNVNFVITENTLLELGYYLLRTGKDAKQTLTTYWQYKSNITASTGYKSIKLKHALRKKKLSYADCVGYCLALELQIPFLTGDNQFEGMPNVEFVR